jgi:putative transcriptional regulator
MGGRDMARTTAGRAEIKARGVALDAARGASTGGAEVRRQMVADGQDPDAAPPEGAGVLPGTIRRRLGMTQVAFAEAIGVPVATLRNWKQGRVAPDLAAGALLRILDRGPEAALRALGKGVVA